MQPNIKSDIDAATLSEKGMHLYVVSSPGMGVVCCFRFKANALIHCNKTLSYYTVHKVWIPLAEVQYWIEGSKSLDSRSETIDHLTHYSDAEVLAYLEKQRHEGFISVDLDRGCTIRESITSKISAEKNKPC